MLCPGNWKVWMNERKPLEQISGIRVYWTNQVYGVSYLNQTRYILK